MVKATFDYSGLTASAAIDPQHPLFTLDANFRQAGSDAVSSGYTTWEQPTDASYTILYPGYTKYVYYSNPHEVPVPANPSEQTMRSSTPYNPDLTETSGFTTSFDNYIRFYLTVPKVPVISEYLHGVYNFVWDEPWADNGFEIKPVTGSSPQFAIAFGKYYVEQGKWYVEVGGMPVERVDLVWYDKDNKVAATSPVRFSPGMTAADVAADNITKLTEAVITGSAFTDQIEGLLSGPTTFIASAGDDKISGSQFRDTFDFSKSEVDIKQTLIGRGETDVLKLSGSPHDYDTAVNYKASPLGHGLNTASWPTTSTTITRALPADASALKLVTSDIERVEFSDRINNKVDLYQNNVLQEMLLLSKEIYDWSITEPHGISDHRAQLAFEEPAGASDFAYRTPLEFNDGSEVAKPIAGTNSRGWHPVNAIELGLKPASYGEFGTLSYSFRDGFYAAFDPADQYGKNGDWPEANALVLSGLVNEKTTVAVVFRGTDQWADINNYDKLAEHYLKFSPLIEALKPYLAPSKGIEQIFVSGDSLGAAMAQYFLREFPSTDERVRGYVEGNPGMDQGASQSGTLNSNLVNIIHTDDAIANAPELSNTIWFEPLRALEGVISGNFPDAITPKFRLGSEIRINSEKSDSYLDLAEHFPAAYNDSLYRLSVLAAEKLKPSDKAGHFHDSLVAGSLRSGDVYHGSPVQIAPGSSGRDSINSKADDTYVLAGGGNDVVSIHGGVLGGELFPKGTREIDGGPGADELIIYGRTHESFVWTLRSDGGYDLDYEGFFGRSEVADLYRIETLTFADEETPAHTPLKFKLPYAPLQKSNVSGSTSDDVLFQHKATGQILFAGMADGAFQGWGALTQALGGSDWKPVGGGQVNPDAVGGAETFVQQQSTGTIYYASFDTGATTWGVVSRALTPDWILRAVADINADGSVDAVVQNQTTGTIYFADMMGGTFQAWGVVNSFLTADWKAVGAGDMTGDGYADVVVQQQSTGTTYFADMAGGQFSGWGVISTNLSADWQVKAVADVDGDAFADAVFQNLAGAGGVTPGTTYYAYTPGGIFAGWGVVADNLTGDWEAKGAADIDADGIAEVLFQNRANGTTYAAHVNGGGTGIPSWSVVADNITSEWQVV